MLQAILRSLRIDIEHIRTIKIMIGLLGFSLLLQLITFTTPGWFVYRNDDWGQAKYAALMYDIRCDEGDCKTYPISENESKKDDWQFQYVSWIVEGLVPILLCSVSLFLFLYSLRNPKWREPFFLICIWILGMAMVLQWELMAPFADSYRISISVRGLGNYYPVPWNIILHSFSAFLTTTVMLVSLVILMKKLIVNVMNNNKTEEAFMKNPDEAETALSF